MAQDYARRHGLELDTKLTFEDLGVSAYRGLNAEAGRLAEFLEAVRCGLVPSGSVLLVEALDRLSRLVPRKAVRVLEDLLEAGVEVVTLNDGRRYTHKSLDDDPTALLIAVVLFMRANEESATKARRLRAAWEQKRREASDTPLTSLCPAWIRLATDPDGVRRLQLIEDRAAVVRRIFDEYLAGSGMQSIASGLETDGVPVFGKGMFWHRSYIGKVLSNPATYGIFTPHRVVFEGARKGRQALDPVLGYFPSVITMETFDAAQTLRQTASPMRPRQDKPANILSGLARCPACGSTMTRVAKGSATKGGRPKLVCVRAKVGGGCEYHGVHCHEVEEVLRREAALLVHAAPVGDEVLDAGWEASTAAADALRVSIANIVEALEGGPSVALQARLVLLETALAEEETKSAMLLSAIDAAGGPLLRKRLEALEVALSADPLNVELANAALRACLTSVVVDYREGVLRCIWRQGGESELRYRFNWPKSK